MKEDHATEETVGSTDRIGRRSPLSVIRPRWGITPSSMRRRSRLKGTPSRPITATRGERPLGDGVTGSEVAQRGEALLDLGRLLGRVLDIL